VNYPRLAAALCFLMPVCASAAEHPAHTAETAPVLPENVAALSFDGVDAIPNVMLASVATGRVASAGVAASLPDLPETTIPGTQLPFYLLRIGAITLPNAPQPERVSLTEPTFDEPEVSLIDASPLAGVAHKIGAQKFNTNDGSLMYDFAICYRLNKRSSVEVIPGDPAPVKLPVATMQNNMGVTVGMVVRLNREP
jgi:hypothetical protein